MRNTKIRFDEEELGLIAIFDEGDRRTAIFRMEETIPKLGDALDMKELLIDTKEKLELISDDDYCNLDLGYYSYEAEGAEAV